MFGNHHHYVPALKWKRGEQRALRGVSSKAKARMTPLIEVTEIPYDFRKKQPRKTANGHVDDSLKTIALDWSPTARFFLDPMAVPTAAQRAFAGAQSRGLAMIPVTGIYRSDAEISAALAHAGNGLCVRITRNDLSSTTLTRDIDSFVSNHSLSPASVDVVIDLGPMEGQPAFVIAAAAESALSSLPRITRWRTLTLLSSTFPQHMGIVETDSEALVDRGDFAAWKMLHAKRSTLKRLPTYGDYGIQHPIGVEGYNPLYMGMAAAIRYTADSQWLLIKGRDKSREAMTVQFPKLARKLVASSHYYGQTHCGGCDCAYRCSKGIPGFGSPEAWRRIGTHHHLELVASQLAALP